MDILQKYIRKRGLAGHIPLDMYEYLGNEKVNREYQPINEYSVSPPHADKLLLKWASPFTGKSLSKPGIFEELVAQRDVSCHPGSNTLSFSLKI